MKRTWCPQPAGKNQCGQVALAVVIDYPLDEAIGEVGKKGCTKTKDLVKVLRHHGYDCPDRCQRIPRPQLAIARLHKPDRSGWHWVVVEDDKIFDGVNGNPDGTVNWKPNWRMTSYLPITKGKYMP